MEQNFEFLLLLLREQIPRKMLSAGILSDLVLILPFDVVIKTHFSQNNVEPFSETAPSSPQYFETKVCLVEFHMKTENSKNNFDTKFIKF